MEWVKWNENSVLGRSVFGQINIDREWESFLTKNPKVYFVIVQFTFCMNPANTFE
jgi:hypothetical protein